MHHRIDRRTRVLMAQRRKDADFSRRILQVCKMLRDDVLAEKITFGISLVERAWRDMVVGLDMAAESMKDFSVVWEYAAEGIDFPTDGELIEAMTAPHWKPVSDDNIQIESKDNIKKKLIIDGVRADGVIVDEARRIPYDPDED
jgi:hypothetical protein